MFIKVCLCAVAHHASSSCVKYPEKHSPADMSPLCCHGIQFICTSTWSVCACSPLAALNSSGV